MLYHYKAKSAAGDIVAGVIEANSTFAAQQDLRQRGQLLLSISRNPTSRLTEVRERLTGGGRRAPRAELLMLTSQLAVMCETGVDLAEAFAEAARQATHPTLRRALQQIHRDISDGQSVAAAMRRQESVFGGSYVSSVAAGESTGQMTEVLNRLAHILEGEIRLRSTLKTVLAYPVVLASLSLVTLGVLLFFVLPHFGDIFVEMNVPLPASTRMLLALSGSLTDDVLLWLSGLAAVVAGGMAALRSPACRLQIDRMLLDTRLLREATRSLTTGRAFRLCGSMVQSGVPLLESLQVARGSIGNRVYRELFNELEVEVLNGNGIGRSMVSARYVPRGAARMVVTGEKTGRLGEVLEKVGAFYELQGERRLQELSRLLEPAIIIAMGALVSLVVLSILLPMFTLTQMARIH